MLLYFESYDGSFLEQHLHCIQDEYFFLCCFHSRVLMNTAFIGLSVCMCCQLVTLFIAAIIFCVDDKHNLLSKSSLSSKHFCRETQ